MSVTVHSVAAVPDPPGPTAFRAARFVARGRSVSMLALVAGFAAQLVVALVVIPPWQNPDEPQHVMTVRLIMTHGPDFELASDVDPASERDIVASMGRYQWWHYYGAATPEPLPLGFADGPAKVVSQYFGPPGGGSRIYYRAAATVFELGSVERLLSQLYVMRLLSAFAAIVSLWCMWSGARRILGEGEAVVLTGLAMLHPQFVFVSTAASPDAFVNLAGSVVWRQAAILVTSGTTVRDVALLWLGALAALVLRRLGAPLIVIAAVVTALVAWRDLVRRNAWRVAVAAATVAVALVAIAAAVVASDLERALSFIRIDPSRALTTVAANADRLPAFFEMLFRTFWLAAGWLRYSGPSWWHATTVAVSLIAAVGLMRVSAERRPAVWMSAIVVLIQVAATVVYHFGILGSGPQGRYLFPVLPFVLCLLCLGWSALVGRVVHRLAPLSLLFVMAFLNVSAWTFVVIPAYT